MECYEVIIKEYFLSTHFVGLSYVLVLPNTVKMCYMQEVMDFWAQ